MKASRSLISRKTGNGGGAVLEVGGSDAEDEEAVKIITMESLILAQDER